MTKQIIQTRVVGLALTHVKVLLIYFVILTGKANAAKIPPVNLVPVNIADSFPHRLFNSNFFYTRHSNDTIPFNFIKIDKDSAMSYAVTGVFYIADKSITFSLTDSLVLNYKRWAVPPSNRVVYTPRGIFVTDLVLTNDSSVISVASQQDAEGKVVVNIRNVDIGDITGIFSKELPLVSGLLDASLVISPTGRILPGFAGTASVKNLVLMQQPLGDIAVTAGMLNSNTIQANFSLSGNSNEANLAGNFCLSDDHDQLDALLDIKKLQLTTLQALAKGLIQFAYGSVNGSIALKGRFKDPEWKGTLNIDSTKFTVNKYGTTYFVDKQQLSLAYPAIGLSNFIIKDSLDHAAVINGNLQLPMLSERNININLKSAGIALVNAPRAINNQLYGYVGADASISISGNLKRPVLKGNIDLSDMTNITLVLPEKNTDKDIARSVVRFIDRDTFALPEKITFRPAADPRSNISKLLNNQLDISSGKQAALTIVMDPTTGDLLRTKGVAKWNAGFDSAGNMVMLGTYRLDSGYYELNYEFLQRRFNIVPGSTVNFNGRPTDALVDIKAEYIANTSAKDLLGNEVGTVDPKIAKLFNQAIPFRVVLFLKGPLRNPEIRFDIQLPANGEITTQLRATIENKLVQVRSDVAATNKQVFALLAMDRFVGEQSTDFFKGNDNSSDFSDIARESVSKFLSSALDQIASDLFKGINIDLNLNSYKDFTTSDGNQKKDLNVEVSKNFLNDRLSVTVGKNFGIESQDGSTKAAQQKASRFLPDVTVNYKLSSDGKYLLRAYNKNPFEVVMDGYIVETGLAFIVTMDYEKYVELFVNKDKKQDQ